MDEYKSEKFTEAELERRIMAVKHPGPEDKVIADLGLAWEFIKDVAKREDWALACKLAKALILIGDIADQAIERAVFWEFDAGLNKEERDVLRSRIKSALVMMNLNPHTEFIPVKAALDPPKPDVAP